MSLIFDIIILLFAIISILLIYSLLMISVESKSFEIGVMRMMGLSKSGLILMIVIQSVAFVLPAIIIGISLTFPALKFLYTYLFDEDMGIDTRPVPSVFSLLQALLLGIAIPIASAILPIRAALSKNLNDSLDY